MVEGVDEMDAEFDRLDLCRIGHFDFDAVKQFIFESRVGGHAWD
jgi:hypothetical protein